MNRPLVHVSAQAPTFAAPDTALANAHRPGLAVAPTLEHCVYESFVQAEIVRGDWDDLAAGHGDLFGTFDWCRIWWQHYGQNRQLQIHVLREGPHLVAVLPLFAETLRPLGMPLRVVRLVGCDHVLTPAGMVVRPDRAEAVAGALLDWLEKHERWDLLHLGPLQCYMETTRPMALAFAASPVVEEVFAGERHSCVTVYEIPETYEKYLAALAGSERRNVLRCQRHAQAERGVSVAAPTNPDEVQQAMTALVQLHQCLWTGKGKLGQFKDWPDYQRFHRDMAQCLLQSGRLALVTLKAADQIVGVEYGYHFGSRTHALIRGYCDQPEWRNYSIGRMLHCHMVEQAATRGATLMDDGRGTFEYKRRLGGQLRFERALTVVRRGHGTHLRTWLAMRAAWLIHAAYDRVWFDWLRPRLHLPARPLRRSYIRVSFLAQLFKRGRCWHSLYGDGEAQYPKTGPDLPPADRADTSADDGNHS